MCMFHLSSSHNHHHQGINPIGGAVTTRYWTASSRTLHQPSTEFDVDKEQQIHKKKETQKKI